MGIWKSDCLWRSCFVIQGGQSAAMVWGCRSLPTVTVESTMWLKLWNQANTELIWHVAKWLWSKYLHSSSNWMEYLVFRKKRLLFRLSPENHTKKGHIKAHAGSVWRLPTVHSPSPDCAQRKKSLQGFNWWVKKCSDKCFLNLGIYRS